MASIQQVKSPLRGVNLGGWLVLEPWITPDLFKGIDARDEYDFCKQANQTVLRQFRDTFVQEDDFAWLAQQGIQAVRLPVGYWLFGDYPPFDATVGYVDKAFRWAAKYNLKILLDVHAVPGSQNGKVHSGRIGAVQWPHDQHLSQTMALLEQLADRYGDESALLGISLLNEPAPHISAAMLKAFYKQAYELIRKRCGKSVWVVFSDGFKPRKWRKQLPVRDYPGLYIDTHHYQIYTWYDKLLPAQLQLWRARHMLPSKLARIAKHHPLVVGEWSVALPAGRSVAGDKYALAQQQAFASSAAWFYWTYKTQYGGPWSFRHLVARNLIA